MTFRLLRTIVLFALLLVAALAGAQVIPLETIDSIDARVLNARTVVVGTVAEFTPAPEKDKGHYEVAIDVRETLKGEPQPRLRLSVWARGPVLDQWKGWQSERTPLLVDVQSGEQSAWRSRATLWEDPAQIYITADFRMIRGPAAARRYIQEVIRRHPGIDRVETYDRKLPDGPVGEAIRKALGRSRLHGIIAPADKRLEREALQQIRSKDPKVRGEGVQSLRYFKSPENADRVRALLKDPAFTVMATAEANRGVELRYFPVRQHARNTLAGWGFAVEPLPTYESINRISTVTALQLQGDVKEAGLALIREAKNLVSLEIPFVYMLPEGLLATIVATPRLTHLRMPGISLNDAYLTDLAALKELRSLSITRNPVTDTGLRTLAGFKSLRELDVSETEVTDAGLDALRRARPDLKVTPARATLPIAFYISHNYLPGLHRILDRVPAAVDGETNTIGGYPLHHAAYERQYDAVRVLLDRGASVSKLDSRGNNALHSAFVFHQPHPRIVELLIGHGVDVNRPNGEGVDPLAQAVGRSNPELIRLLLACGADPFKVTQESLGYARPAPEIMALVNEQKALRTNPVAIVPTTFARCERTVYALSPDGILANWTTKPLGQFTAPLQWSPSPLGRSVLGPLGQQSATLRVPSLPAHRNVRVEIDLFLIGSWDGNGGLTDKPDLFDIAVPGVGTLLHSTFDNHDEGDHRGLPMQSFPAPYPHGFHRSFTGASEVRSLGYEQLWNGQTFRRDAVYRLVFTFAHASPELELVLSSLSVTEGEGSLEETERWGIGRVVVKTD